MKNMNMKEMKEERKETGQNYQWISKDMNGTERHMNGNEKKCKRNMKGNDFSELDLGTFEIHFVMKPTSHGLF